MKKKVLILGVLLMGMSAGAKITVDWKTNWEVLDNGGGQLPIGSIAQLIFSPDSNISSINAGTPFIPQGGEVLLGTFTFTGGDGYIDLTVNFTPAAGYLDGTSVSYGIAASSPLIAGAMVYTRAFNSSTTPTYYGEGGMDTALNEQLPAPTFPDVSNIAIVSNYQLTTPIPEPGAGLLVLAGAAVAIFRRRRQQD